MRRPRAVTPVPAFAWSSSRLTWLLVLALLLFTARGSLAQSAPEAAPPAGTELCGAEILLDSSLARDPGLAARLEQFEVMLREAERKGLLPPAEARRQGTAASPIYTIPVAVHIMHHPQNAPGQFENISDNQVLSQIAALNRDFQNLLNSGSPAADCQIKFCLATSTQGTGVTWSTTPGITRHPTSTPTVDWANQATDAALKLNGYLPAAQYLNIWVVEQILNSGGVVGYAYLPGTVQPALDGIVMAYRYFGSNTTTNNTFSLLAPGYTDGKVAAHEVGHYLNLLHTFHNGCTGQNDQVCDTPVELQNNWNCPSTAPVSNCTDPCTNATNTLPNPIENFMEYTNDNCRWAFTAGQKTRMHFAIAAFRSQLVSSANLIATGVTCTPGLNAPIVLSQGQACTGSVVQCSTPASGSGIVYSWTFAGGTPANSSLQVQNVTFSTPGVHAVTLIVKDANNNISTNTSYVYVTACSPILEPCSRWVFAAGFELDFTSGVPAPVNGTLNPGPESGAQVCDANGNLLFYTDEQTIWTKNNTVMPNGTGILGGNSCHNGAIICRRPGSANQYFLFTVDSYEAGQAGSTTPLHVTTVDMSLNGALGDVVGGQKNIMVPLPGNPERLIESVTLVPHCNGVDWWLITHGGYTWNTNVYVTLVTASGPVSSTSYPIGIGGPTGQYSMWGAITGSRDGTRIAICQALAQTVRVYNFNRTTGVPTLAYNTGNVGANQDVAFSPNGKLVYFCFFDANSGTYGLKQLELSSNAQRTINFPGPERDVELGPDGKVYVSLSQTSALGCINFPDNFNLNNQNECGYNPASVILGTGTAPLFAPLPNQPQMCTGVQAAQFSYTITNCYTVNFTSPNCVGPWTWTFGDNTGGSGQTVSHTYSTGGTYQVTLTVTGASPPSVTIPVTVGPQPISISGPVFACGGPLNYSVVGPSNYNYSWIITGGAPNTATGTNVFVTWLLSGGSIQVTGTDPKTGCTATAFIGVEACGKCDKPPLGMLAWWPMDETGAGVEAQEIVAANDVQDINGPAKVAGAVSNARQFNGTSTFLRLNDPLKLNLGTSNLTLDAWVNTTQGTATLGIVDKRLLNPEQGYAMYLRQGYLALRLGDGTAGTEYWNTTTPFLANGAWHHVAATEDRGDAQSGTRLYVDGSLVATFPGFSPTASLDNQERLVIGALEPWLTPNSWFSGKIDELEIFNRALSAQEIGDIWGAGAAGKCKEFCQVPWDQTLCNGANTIDVSMQICNMGTQNYLFNASFAPLPSGTQGAAGGCSWAGPTTFQVLSPTLPTTVNGGTCKTVTVRITRPSGMPNGYVACYAATITNQSTGLSHECHGSIWSSSQACPDPWSHKFWYIGAGQTAAMQWRLVNVSPSPRSIPVTVEAMPSDMSEPMGPGGPPGVISLNGLPPGVPWTAIYDLLPGESTFVSVDAAFTEPRVFQLFDVILNTDADQDGNFDASSSIGLLYTDRPPSTAGEVPPPLPTRLAILGVTPNPFRQTARVDFMVPRRGRVRLGLFDIGGRRLRTLLDGPMAAGRSSRSIDASALASGAYFLRLEMDGEVQTRRAVLLR